jgi:hypothetical protein
VTDTTERRWTLSAGKRTTSWQGRVFVTYQATDPEGVHRTVTVIARHDRQAATLVTGREARRIARRALAERGDHQVHQTIDPDDMPADWWVS